VVPTIVLPMSASAQLEEILVTAQRRETNLQSTPISIQAFTAEELETGGIQAGRDLGIMVPNLVANPQGGGVGAPQFYIRGLPGVGIYIDGIWQSSYGFLESNFTEVERVEVLRGPQGTLFGRNTNGGAINITTRAPADEFGARMNFEVGEYNRRNATFAVDLPLSESFKTKWMVSSLKNDGFLQSRTVPRALGGQDDQLFRFDALWEPTETFSLRFTANDEDKTSTEPRIVRFTNLNNVRYVQYNVLAGNPDFVNIPGFVAQNWGLPSNAFTPETHQPGYAGGELGEWETRSDTPDNGIRRDLRYYTMTLNWDITDNLTLESITSSWELNRRQSVDFDGSEFTVTTDEARWLDNNFTQEFHLTGSNFNDRVNWLAGLYTLEEETKNRTYRWPMLDFPRAGTTAPGLNTFRADVAAYLNSWWIAAGRPTLQGGGIAANPPAFIDNLTENESEQKAFFGEVTIGLTEKLDMTLGVRITDDDATSTIYNPTDGFIPPRPGDEPRGDIYAGTVRTINVAPDFGRNTTNKFALQYQLNDDIMLYGSWGEGFTEANIQNANLPTIVGACPNVALVQTPVRLAREIITNREVGMRSDWLEGTLRFNATYFDATWGGMRVNNLPLDPCTGAPSPNPYLSSEGAGAADGFEFEVVYAATDRLRLNIGLGLIDTEYSARGFYSPVTGGIAPNSPFAYAPDNSASIGVQYELPLSSGGRWQFNGNYGWSDKYVRDAASQRTPLDANGNFIYEPAYGVLNARAMYEPAEANWAATVWGTNLTDELYVNGGFDTRNVWGYDFSVIGRPREVGVSVDVRF
jgi:iron complex outermembrane receptor protein